MNPVWHFLNGVPYGPTIAPTAVLAGDGTAGAPSYSFASQSGIGLYRFSAGNLGVTGNLLFSGAYNIGDGAGNSPVDIYAEGQIIAGSAFLIGAAGSATSTRKLVKKVTGIPDAAATGVLTVTVPNANHAATIKVTLLSSNGSTDAFESSRTAEGAVVVTRTTGVATVATAATLTLTGIATVAAGATHTLAYSVSSITGAAGATQTFTIDVTIDDSGNLGSNQCVVLAEVINAEATGITIV